MIALPFFQGPQRPETQSAAKADGLGKVIELRAADHPGKTGAVPLDDLRSRQKAGAARYANFRDVTRNDGGSAHRRSFPLWDLERLAPLPPHGLRVRGSLAPGVTR